MIKRFNIIQSLLIILTFVIALYGKNFLHHFIDFTITSSIFQVLYFYLWWVIPCLLTLSVLFGIQSIFKELGLNKGFITGFVFAFVTVLPMFASSIILGKFDANLKWFDLLHYTLISGVMEEFLFRGFLFGLLFKKFRWGFVPVSMLGATFFGLGHLYQSTNLVESISIFMVTFMGALWFAWLFIEWRKNLWVPIFLHVFMNLSWVLFDVSNNAAGTTLANIFRMVTIALTIVITIFYNKRKKLPREINKANLFFNR